MDNLEVVAAIIGSMSGVMVMLSMLYQVYAKRRQAGAFVVLRASGLDEPLRLYLENAGAATIYHLSATVAWCAADGSIRSEELIGAQRLAEGEAIAVPVPVSSDDLKPMRFDELVQQMDYLEIVVRYGVVPKALRRYTAHIRVGITQLGSDDPRFHRKG
jgi:hypothetical protein